MPLDKNQRTKRGKKLGKTTVKWHNNLLAFHSTYNKYIKLVKSMGGGSEKKRKEIRRGNETNAWKNKLTRAWNAVAAQNKNACM